MISSASIALFLDATGQDDVEAAKFYIDSAGGDVGKAVALFCAGVGCDEDGEGEVYSGSVKSKRSKKNSKVLTPMVDDDDTPAPLPTFNERLLIGSDEFQSPVNSGTQLRVNSMTSYGVDAKSSDNTGFSNLFSPPVDMIFKGSLEEARMLGRSTSAWVLVNIQKDDEFSSHALNRDVWRQDSVQEIIKASFVFWQRSFASSQGKEFCHFYKVMQYPYIGVLCSQTGRLMKSWHTKKFAEELGAISELMDFIENSANIPICPNRARSSNSTVDNGNEELKPESRKSDIPPFSLDSVKSNKEFEEQTLPVLDNAETGRVLGMATDESGHKESLLAALHREREMRLRQKQVTQPPASIDR